MEPQRNEAIPKAIQDELARLFPDLSHEEALQHQESLYQSLKTSNVKQTAATSSRNEASTSSGSSNERNSSGEPSRSYNDEHDLALDEALARSLEELDMDDLTTAIYFEKFHSTPSNTGSLSSTSRVPEITPAPAPAPSSSPSPAPVPVVVVEDDINPDEMTYEELQSLGESIGIESKGMPQSEISRLPTRIYKTGFFRKKINLGECPVCFSGYKNESFTTLPCTHQYHMKCINEWLAQNKTCPICKKEVVPS